MSYQQVLLRRTLAGEPVRRFMTDHPMTVAPSTSIKDLVENYVYRYHFNMFPVVEDGHLLGCVNLRQLKKIPREQWDHLTTANVAVPCSPENTIPSDTDAVNAFARMSRAHRNRLMVVDHDRLVGVIALKDLLNFLSRRLEFEGT
jgi:predicted transcriptional regulator